MLGKVQDAPWCNLHVARIWCTICRSDGIVGDRAHAHDRGTCRHQTTMYFPDKAEMHLLLSNVVAMITETCSRPLYAYLLC
jgi:hypothetical protein